jgi:hypothetical protein
MAKWMSRKSGGKVIRHPVTPRKPRYKIIPSGELEERRDEEEEEEEEKEEEEKEE